MRPSPTWFGGALLLLVLGAATITQGFQRDKIPLSLLGGFLSGAGVTLLILDIRARGIDDDDEDS